jgi:hypothetical protein
MDPNRTPDQEQDDQSTHRRSVEQSVSSSADSMLASPMTAEDEFDGQLGPDELPDPAEVVMNHEAKRHH